MTWRRRGLAWLVVLSAVAGLATACSRSEDYLDTNVPESIEEACTWLDLPPQPPTQADVEAVSDEATGRVADKYEVESTEISTCDDQFVLSIGISSGEVSDADRAFIVDNVGVILIAQHDIKAL